MSGNLINNDIDDFRPLGIKDFEHAFKGEITKLLREVNSKGRLRECFIKSVILSVDMLFEGLSRRYKNAHKIIDLKKLRKQILNLCNDNGDTLLLLAVKNKHNNFFKFLLEDNSVDPFVRDKNGYSVFDYVIQNLSKSSSVTVRKDSVCYKMLEAAAQKPSEFLHFIKDTLDKYNDKYCQGFTNALLHLVAKFDEKKFDVLKLVVQECAFNGVSFEDETRYGRRITKNGCLNNNIIKNNVKNLLALCELYKETDVSVDIGAGMYGVFKDAYHNKKISKEEFVQICNDYNLNIFKEWTLADRLDLGQDGKRTVAEKLDDCSTVICGTIESLCLLQ